MNNVAFYIGDLNTVDFGELVKIESIEDFLNGKILDLSGALGNSFRTGLIQLILTWTGYKPGTIDSSMGANSLTALHNFQAENTLPICDYISPEAATKFIEKMRCLLDEN